MKGTNPIRDSKKGKYKKGVRSGTGLSYAFERALLEGKKMYVSKLLQHIDLSRFDENISLKYKFKPSAMIKALIFKKLKNIDSNPRLSNYLKNNKKDARRLGFLKDENDNLMIPDRRTFDRYERKLNQEIKDLILNIEETIRHNIDKNCLITDIDLEKNKELEKKSERTKQRKKEEKFKKLSKFVKERIYPHIKMYINDNAVFDKQDFLDMLVHCAMSHDFTHNGSLTLKETQDERTPSSDAFLYHLRKYESISEVQKIFEKAFNITNKMMKSNGLFNQKLDVAIDYTSQLYYGDKNDHMVVGTKPKRGTSWAFKFASINVVVDGKRITLLCLPVGFGAKKEDIVRKLLKYAKKWIKINHVFCDRGFFNTQVIKTIKKLNLKFVMPVIKNSKIKRIIQAMDKTNSVTDFIPKDKDEESFKLYPDTSVIPYTMKGSNRDEQVRFKVVLVDAKDKEREGQKYGFATNMDVNRNDSKIVEYLYDKRWGIETSYRVGKDFLAKTTSKNYLIRLFFFQFSMILYNCWVIVNALLGIAMFGHVPQKPIVSAKLFGTVLYSIIKDDIT